jgi:DNA-binding response OmpR family regulator
MPRTNELRRVRIGLDLIGLLRHGGRRGVVILSARGQKADKLSGHRDQLLKDVWATGQATARSVDIAIARLRKKIEDDPHAPRFIRTVHGDGYCLTLDVQE